MIGDKQQKVSEIKLSKKLLFLRESETAYKNLHCHSSAGGEYPLFLSFHFSKTLEIRSFSLRSSGRQKSNLAKIFVALSGLTESLRIKQLSKIKKP
jgi:hypothetical protein